MEYIPFTYLIGWSKINKWYYGAHYANNKQKIANPENLWVTYFTSSKYIASYRKTYGEPDVIQVRKIFSSKTETIRYEHKVLRLLNVVSNTKWINKSSGGLVIDYESITRAGESRRGYTHTEKAKQRMSEKRKGIPKTESFKIHMSQKLKGRLITEQWRKNISEGRKNMSDETRKIYSESNRRNQLLKSKTYEFIKDNQLITINNLTAFCKEHKLCFIEMKRVYNKEREKPYRGFSIL